LRPDAGDFLLFGQEKVTKEKATPVPRAERVTLCCLLDLGGCGTRLAETKKRLDQTQTVLADIPEVKRAARRDTGAPTA
jgi:hypothetical protein